MKLMKLMAVSVLALVSFTATAQSPLNPWQIKNLPTVTPTTTRVTSSFIPVYYANGAYKMNLATAVDSVFDCKFWTGLITQSSTSAPTATVLRNTTGTSITWTRDSKGVYIGEVASNILASGKVWAVATPTVISDNAPKIAVARLSDSTIVVRTFAPVVDTLIDAHLSATPLEIRIYN